MSRPHSLPETFIEGRREEGRERNPRYYALHDHKHRGNWPRTDFFDDNGHRYYRAAENRLDYRLKPGGLMLTEAVAPGGRLVLYPVAPGGGDTDAVAVTIDSFGPITSGRQRSGYVLVRGTVPIV